MASDDKPTDTVTAEQRTTHIQSLMDRLVAASTIYNIFLSPCKLISTTKGVVTTHLLLTKDHVNSRGSLHGAVSAAIVDFTTGLSIASVDLRDSTGASVDMHISYLSTAAVGDTLEIVATAERVGGSLGYTSVKISKLVEGGEPKLVTLGQHTKFVKLPGQNKV